jgi:5-methylcytosine-specific restriction endonuclease McrA
MVKIREKTNCRLCKREIIRPTKYSAKQWNEVRYCSKSCRSKVTVRRLWEDPVYRQRQVVAHTGYKMPREQVEKRASANRRPRPEWRGENCSNWKGGIFANTPPKEYFRMQCRKRRARKHQAKGTHSAQDWEALKAKYNFTCLCCGKREPDIKLTEDHIIPITRGGADDISNIQPLCQPCNSRKLTRTTDWIRRVTHL